MPWWRSAHTPEIDSEQLNAVIDRNVALARRLGAPERELLGTLTVELLRAKDWEAANEFTLTPEITVTLAANAAIPILAIGIDVYDRVHTIIVRPTAARSSGLRAGPSAGTVSDDEVWTDGISLPDRGPVAISWDVARHESRHPAAGRNVVIHEFAHKIDMSDGLADGTPPASRPKPYQLGSATGRRIWPSRAPRLRRRTPPLRMDKPRRVFRCGHRNVLLHPSRSRRRQTHPVPSTRRLLPPRPRLKRSRMSCHLAMCSPAGRSSLAGSNDGNDTPRRCRCGLVSHSQFDAAGDRQHDAR